MPASTRTPPHLPPAISRLSGVLHFASFFVFDSRWAKCGHKTSCTKPKHMRKSHKLTPNKSDKPYANILQIESLLREHTPNRIALIENILQLHFSSVKFSPITGGYEDVWLLLPATRTRTPLSGPRARNQRARNLRMSTTSGADRIWPPAARSSPTETFLV